MNPEGYWKNGGFVRSERSERGEGGVMNKPTIGHYASHQRDVTAQEDAALNAALRSSTIKVEHPEIARLRAELAVARADLAVSVGHLSRLAEAYGCEDFTTAVDAALAAKGE